MCDRIDARGLSSSVTRTALRAVKLRSKVMPNSEYVTEQESTCDAFREEGAALSCLGFSLTTRLGINRLEQDKVTVHKPTNLEGIVCGTGISKDRGCTCGQDAWHVSNTRMTKRRITIVGVTRQDMC